MIQDQGTGTPPDTNTAEQPVHRYGVFTYEVPATGRSAHGAPEAETEVAS
jgi:hypothetical protein